MTGNAFRVFFDSFARVGGSCHLPRVALDEVLNKYGEQLRDLGSKLSSLSRKWSLLTGDHLETAVTEDLIEAKIEQYKCYLTERLKAARVEMISYPETPHERLVERAVQRRRPFRDKGAGYRDALIWESILQLLGDSQPPVYFVTHNHRDFGKAPDPHPDLLADLDARSIPHSSVRIFQSLDELNRELILPRLEKLDDLARQLDTDEFDKFSLRTWAAKELIELLKLEEWGHALVGLGPDHCSVYVTSLQTKDYPRLDDVRLLPSGNVLVSANVDTGGEVSVSVSSENCRRYEDVREFMGDDCSGDWDADVPVDTEANVAFTLILQADTYKVLSEEVDVIDGLFGTTTANPHPRQARQQLGAVNCQKRRSV